MLVCGCSAPDVHLGLLALGFTLLALGVSAVASGAQPIMGIFTPEQMDRDYKLQHMFSGLLVDTFTVYVRIFCSGLPRSRLADADRIRSRGLGRFYALLGPTLGMAPWRGEPLLMAYMAWNGQLPSYALPAIQGNRASSEAALKCGLRRRGAGVMLYGISLLAGKFGTAYLPDIGFADGMLARVCNHDRSVRAPRHAFIMSV